MNQKILTGDETVQEVLMMYLQDHVSSVTAKELFDKYISENRDYITHVLNRKCREKWGHCQVSMLALDELIVETLKPNHFA